MSERTIVHLDKVTKTYEMGAVRVDALKEITFEIRAVGFVHRGEVAHVGEVDVGLDDVLGAQIAGFQYAQDRVHAAARQSLDVAFDHLSRHWVEGDLARDEY